MTRTVAVTGATGFIGGHLVQRLGADGWTVRVLARQLPVHPHFGGTPVEAVIGALDDEGSLRELVEGVDAVVHAAGLIKARSRADFFATNAAGVARLAKVAAGQPVPPRFILISTLAAREPTLSSYAASKRAGETALAEIADLAWTIIRPPAIYGPGDRETLAFFRAVAKGVAPLLGSDKARLSLLHVQDLAAAVAVLLSQAGEVGATHEIDDGRPGGYSWRELIETAAAHLGTTPRTIRVPRPLLHAVAATNGLLARLSGRVPILTADKVREICHSDWVCHDQVFGNRTGWSPTLSLKQGFAGTIGWYRQQGWL
jgi:2-alkyl-3-oxoalkanoate reductase